MVYLRTEHLILRTPQSNEVLQYATINELRATSKNEVQRTMLEWQGRGAVQVFLILPNVQWHADLVVSEGTVVGFIQIAPVGRNEVSFRTFPSARGRGYMKEACVATFTHWLWMGGGGLFVETRRDNVPVVNLMNGFGLDGVKGCWAGGSISWNFG